MAISIRGTAGAWVAATATTQTVTLPTHATGDMLLVRVGMKHATLPGNITCATAGWAKIGQFNNGTTASGNGTGDVCVAVFWKIATSAAETNPVITYHASVAATPSAASPIVFQKDSSESWIEPPPGDGGAIAAATSMSATIQTHIPAKSGDMLVGFIVTNDNTTLTVPTVTQTGLTLATVAEAPATALSDATSNDIAADAFYRLVTAGTSSAAAVVTGTNSVADVGAGWTTRLRVVTEPAGSTIYPTDTAGPLTASTSLVSLFTGSDENPLSEGGTWAALDSSKSQWRRVSNVALSPSSSGAASGSYYNVSTYGPNVFVHATVASAPTAGQDIGLAARISGAGGSGTWDGYALTVAATGTVGTLWRVDNATATSLGTFTTTAAVGDQYGLSCFGTEITAWRIASGGSAWVRMGSATDATYTSAGHVGFYRTLAGTIGGWDNLYAGTDAYPGVDREAWTSRGAGVQTDVVNTATGPTASIQFTDTAGGTVVDWYTKPLTATTLATAVRVNARLLESNAAANATVACEIARVEADGTSPSVWGSTTHGTEAGTSEAAHSFLVTGDDLAVSNGQRLRIRFSIDDATGVSMAASQTVTLYYAGTSGGASGDTYLTFTQTLTEFSAGTTVTPTTLALVVASAGVPTVTASNHQLVTPTTATLASTAFAPIIALAVIPPTVALTTAAFAPRLSNSAYAAAVQALAPLGYWRLGEPSGTVAYSLWGPNLEYFNTPTLGASSLLTTDNDTAATFSRASNEAVGVADPGAGFVPGTDGISVMAWVKFGSIAGTEVHTILSWADQDGSIGYHLLYYDNDDGKLHWQYANGGVQFPGTTWAPGTATHLVVITHDYTAESIKFYIDGALVDTIASSTTIPVDGSQPLRWAQYVGSSSALNGSLDEVALFDTILTLGNVQALYTLGSAAPQLVTPTTAALTLTTFAPTVTATAHQSVTPTTLALTIATFAPTVTATNHQSVTPSTVALVTATFAPTVTASDHQTVTPTTAALSLATFAPTVTATLAVLVTPTTAALTLATFAPTVTASDHQTVTPTTAALTLAAFAPVLKLSVIPTTVALTTAAFAPTVTASNHQTVTPTTASLALTTFAATVSLSNNQSVTPTTATLTLATFAPVLKLVVTPSSTALTLTTFAPTVSATAHVVATPTTLALTLTTFAATVTATAHQTVTPTTVALVLTTQAPSVTTGGNVEFVPNPVALTLTTFAPTVTGAQNVTVTPTTAALTVATFAATVTATAHQTVTPTTLALALAVFTPAVTATDSKVAIPTTAALTTTKFAPTVTASNHQTATPTTKALTLATFASVVSATAHQVATPTTVALTLTRFAPTVTASNVTGVTPSTASLTLTTYAPTVTAIANIVVTPTTAALTLTAYAPQLRQTVTPSTASLTLATFAPSANVSDNTYVVPGTLPLVLTGYEPDAVGIGPVTIVPSTAGLVLVGYAPLVFEAGPIDFIDGELVVADPVRGVLVVTSPHHGASVGANGRGRTTLVVTTPYIKGDVESN